MSLKQTLLLGYVLVLFLILVVRPAEAQPSRLDSLISVLDQKDLDQGERVFTLGRLAAHHYFEGNKVAGDQRMEEAIALAQRISDNQYLARTYAIQAMQLRIQGQTEKAWQALASSLDAEKDIQNFSVKGYVWYAKGWMETRDDLNDKAIESFVQGLGYYNESDYLSDSDQATKATIYNELYAIYGSWNDFSNMEKYARLSLAQARVSRNPDALNTALYSLAFTFENKYRNQPVDREFLDSAAYYYKESVATFKRYQNQISAQNQLPFNAIGLANLYSEFYPISYKDSAQVYLDIALEEGLKTKQYTVVAGAYGIMNEYAQLENRWDDAEKYLLLAASYIQQEELPSIETLSRVMRSLSAVYEHKQDYRSALKYYKEYLTLYETRFDNEKMAIGKELEARYESELKEQRLQMLEDQVSHRKTLNTIYSILVLIALLAILFLWMLYRQRTKAYKQQEYIHEIALERIRQEHRISLLSAMIDGQENERTRIARDLHDGLGGLLSGTKIMLSGNKEAELQTGGDGLYKQVMERLDQAVDELRRIARNMMPEVLLKYGLVEALKEYGLSLKRSGVNITFQNYNYQNQLSENKQVVVYRVAQELVNNSLKYANAQHILVELRQVGDQLSLLVEDDGRGFDKNQLKENKGSGLGSVEARAVFLHGKLVIDSIPGTGTSITLVCPV